MPDREGTSNEEKAVVEVEIKGEGRCPFCGSTRLYRQGICEPRHVLQTWINWYIQKDLAKTVAQCYLYGQPPQRLDYFDTVC